MASGAGLRWRRRRDQSWLLFILAALLAVATALPAEWLGPRWVRLALALACAAGGVALQRSKEAARERGRRADVIANSILTVAGKRTHRPPRVREATLHDLGIHKSLVTIPYLRRDAQEALRQALTAGNPVLVVGNSLSGKTHMAARIVQEEFAEWPIIIPNVPSGMSDLISSGALPVNTVVWLDDLDRYIEDPKTLRANWLNDFTGADSRVVATMREKAYERFRPTGNLPSTQWQLLNDFYLIRLIDIEAERQRLANESGDERTREGVARNGLGAYVGGGPLAVECMDSAENLHPLAYALLRAAADWARSGIGEVIPAETAQALISAYLSDRQREDDREGIDAAIAWATSWDTGRDAFRLLTPRDGGWRAFDYLLDNVTIRGDPIPDATWMAVSAADAATGNLITAGVTAYSVGRSDTARHLLRRAAGSGDTNGMTNLGVLFEMQGDVAEAERWYRRAVDFGNAGAMTRLGTLLARRDEVAEAERWYRRAVDLGDAEAMTGLSLMLSVRGDMPEAEPLLQKAAELREPFAMTTLGARLIERGELADAEQLFRWAADRGYVDAMVGLASVLAIQGETAEAQRWHRRADELRNAQDK